MKLTPGTMTQAEAENTAAATRKYMAIIDPAGNVAQANRRPALYATSGHARRGLELAGSPEGYRVVFLQWQLTAVDW